MNPAKSDEEYVYCYVCAKAVDKVKKGTSHDQALMLHNKVSHPQEYDKACFLAMLTKGV